MLPRGVTRRSSWKAAHYLDRFDSEGHAVGAMSKVLCGELLFGAVFKAMQVMGERARSSAPDRALFA